MILKIKIAVVIPFGVVGSRDSIGSGVKRESKAMIKTSGHRAFLISQLLFHWIFSAAFIIPEPIRERK